MYYLTKYFYLGYSFATIGFYYKLASKTYEYKKDFVNRLESGFLAY